MKTREQIISYIEGWYAAMPIDAYTPMREMLKEILDYCHDGETDEPRPPLTTTPYVTTEPLYCYFEPSKPCCFYGNCIACTRFNHSTITTATNTGDNEQD